MKNLLEKQEKNNHILEGFNLENYEITDETEVGSLEPILSIQESVFCAKGEISFISGKPKVGKTTIASILISTCLTKNPSFDTLGFISHLQGTEKIIFIDTEQSKRSTKKILERIKRNLNVFQKPANFRIFNFRALNYLQIRTAFDILLKDHPNTRLWIIDGIADMVSSVNDEKEAKELLHYFGEVVSAYECGMIIFLHENSTALNDKMRGHLGSEAQRKCFATISVSKDKEKQLHAIKAVDFRESGHFDEIFFRYDPEMKTFVRLATQEVEYLEQEKRHKKLNQLYELASVLRLDEKVSYSELKERIMNFGNISERTAKTKIQKMIENKIITRTENTEKCKNVKKEYFYSLPLRPALALNGIS